MAKVKAEGLDDWQKQERQFIDVVFTAYYNYGVETIYHLLKKSEIKFVEDGQSTKIFKQKLEQLEQVKQLLIELGLWDTRWSNEVIDEVNSFYEINGLGGVEYIDNQVIIKLENYTNEYKLLHHLNCFETDLGGININTFQDLFPNITWKELDDILTKIERLNQGEKTTHFFIQKSSNGDYLLFNKKSESLFRGNDELELVKILDELNPSETGQRSNLYLNGFESIRKEKAFFSTLRMNTRNIEALETAQNITNGSNNLYFFSNKYQHRLVEKLKKRDIILSVYNGQAYYKTQFEMKSTANKAAMLMEERVKITALGKTRKTLKNLTRRLNKTLKDPITQISLFMYFRKLKAQLMSAESLPIATDDDLIILLGAQVEGLRIVKLEGENEFLIVSN